MLQAKACEHYWGVCSAWGCKTNDDHMNADPQKFFIGLMDFFSIMLPGAPLTFLFRADVGRAALGKRYQELADAPLSWSARAPSWLAFGRERNLAVHQPTRTERQPLEPLQAGDAVNTFQRCKTLLAIESPASLAIVPRFEADSQVFRCLAVVLAILLAVWLWRGPWLPAAIPLSLALLVLALWRYMEQRLMGRELGLSLRHHAHRTERQGGPRQGRSGGRPGDPCRGRGVPHVLGRDPIPPSRSQGDPKQWLQPNRHIEAGDQPGETTLGEEAGLWACIDEILGDVRKYDWQRLRGAVGKAGRNEARELLRTAEHPRSTAR